MDYITVSQSIIGDAAYLTPNDQYTLRRTTTPRRGATTTPRRTTGAPTTTAPPAPTHPARTTPRAQTTALASIVLKAMKPPASNREIIRCFMTVSFWLHVIRWSYSISRRGRSGRRDNGWFPRKHVSSIVDQALQPVRGHIQRRVIPRVLVSASRFGALRVEDVVDLF